MKLTIREDSKNYACTVVKLPTKQKVEGLDNLVKVTIFGNDVLTKKDADENELYLFFPAECAISQEYLSANNEFRNTNLNKNTAQKGYFEDNCRVKAIKFKGVISTGYLAPLNTLLPLVDIKGFKEGDEFTTINGHDLCKKYIVKHIHTEGIGGGQSKYNKKLKRFDKLIPNQFRFHNDTAQLARNLHVFHPEDIIVITDKWHGTSAVFANLQIKAELTLREKIGRFFYNLISGECLGEPTKYDNLYSSRSVIKNQYINKEQGGGFYGEDIWAIVNKELEGKIEQGISIYGEIVGFLPSGKAIQKGYDYGCLPPEREFVRTGEDPRRHKFLVYRITYTKPDGNVIEFSWQQIKNYCQKYQLEHVKELYFGPLWATIRNQDGKYSLTPNIDDIFNMLCYIYLEKDCKWCVNKVPAEGIVVRRDGLESYSAFKLKAKRFLERETKELDKGELDIETEQTL